jgi:hypothetical protein
VWGAIVRSFGRPFWIAGLVKLVHDIFMFASPFLLEQLLHHLGRADADPAAHSGEVKRRLVGHATPRHATPRSLLSPLPRPPACFSPSPLPLLRTCLLPPPACSASAPCLT